MAEIDQREYQILFGGAVVLSFSVLNIKSLNFECLSYWRLNGGFGI